MTNYNISQLTDKYELIGSPIDLARFHEKDGEKFIFDLLSSFYRPKFENNQRIVVIQPDNDRYSYVDNIASDALIFLQKSLQKIDISNFFVIVATGNKNIEEELKWLQTTHSTDLNAIGHLIVDTEFKKNTKINDTFCVNMWNHLYVSTQAEILPCCQAKQDRPLGNLTEFTVEQIINNKIANNIRLKMLSGQRCNRCESCYALEDSGIDSRRVLDNHKFEGTIDQLKSQTNLDGSLKSFLPQTLDIRLNNICNLMCRTCNGVSSSMLATEEKILFNNTANFKKNVNANTRERVLSLIIKYFDSAEKINFLGGEPVILKEQYDILEYLIKINKIDTPILYTTNFTKLNLKEKSILEYWKKFTRITVRASIDGHGRVFEYVRHGAKWHDIEHNLLLLKQECPNINFRVTSTISLLSVESVIELQQMWHTTNKLDINNFEIHLMAGSNYLSLQSLLPDHKKNISKKIDSHSNWLSKIGAVKLEQDWRGIQEYMLSDDKSYSNKEYAKVNRMRDIAREENFETIYPQFINLYQPYYNQ